MSEAPARTFTTDFKRFFAKGLVIVLPSVLTLWIVVKAYQFIDNAIAQPINGGVRLAMGHLAVAWEPLRVFDPTEQAITEAIDAGAKAGRGDTAPAAIRRRLRLENITKWWNERWYMDLIGLIIAIVAVYIAGRVLGSLLGRSVYRKLEGFITSLPIFKQVYPYVKQVVDFLFSDERPREFNRVVAVEYPRKGIWSVGFLTGGSLKAIEEMSGNSLTIFIPSSPTPFTGYTITVRPEDVFEMPITVEEAIRFAVSGGVLVPDRQRISLQEGEDGPTIQSPTRTPPQKLPSKDSSAAVPLKKQGWEKSDPMSPERDAG